MAHSKSRSIQRTRLWRPCCPSKARRYVFHTTWDDTEFTLELPVTPETTDDVELFYSVLVGYATDSHDDVVAPHGGLPAIRAYQNANGGSAVDEGVVPEEDLRGRFVLIHEGSGEIIGALDRLVRVHENPLLGEKGHEADPVVVKIPEGMDMLDNVGVLVCTVLPEDLNWMMWGAVFASHVISSTATVLTSTMTSASNYYIMYSTPSPHTTGGTTPSTPDPSSSSSSNAPPPPPPPPPSRTLLLLQSPTTWKHRIHVHTVSSSAVKLSNKADLFGEARRAMRRTPSFSVAATATGSRQILPLPKWKHSNYSATVSALRASEQGTRARLNQTDDDLCTLRRERDDALRDLNASKYQTQVRLQRGGQVEVRGG